MLYCVRLHSSSYYQIFVSKHYLLHYRPYVIFIIVRSVTLTWTINLITVSYNQFFSLHIKETKITYYLLSYKNNCKRFSEIYRFLYWSRLCTIKNSYFQGTSHGTYYISSIHYFVWLSF